MVIMNFLYLSTLCSESKFKLIFEKSEVKPQQQAQKFHRLLSEGLCEYAESMCYLSRPPINKTTNENINLVSIEKISENQEYHYLKVANNPLVKHMSLFFSAIINTFKWNFKFKKEERAIFCDILNLSISISALITSKLCRVKSVAIITDLPNYMNYTKQKKSAFFNLYTKLYRGLCNYFLKRYDYYLILTEQMNELVNPKNKPYLVIEGMVDVKMNKIPNKFDDKYEEKVIIYAGALYEKYGVKSLIEAFIELKDKDARLWLFGDGDLVKEINTYQEKDSRIKYYGVVPNERVVKEQLKATLLVNPRPSIEEFTKYSFPSKNMEYMVSGTPVLTTPLQGMPQEYDDYVYLFEDETVDGMIKTLTAILSKDKTELHDKGIRAKDFVLIEKNNVVQARKIINMIKK